MTKRDLKYYKARGLRCEKCLGVKFTTVEKNKVFACRSCGQHYGVKGE